MKFLIPFFMMLVLSVQAKDRTDLASLSYEEIMKIVEIKESKDPVSFLAYLHAGLKKRNSLNPELIEYIKKSNTSFYAQKNPDTYFEIQDMALRMVNSEAEYIEMFPKHESLNGGTYGGQINYTKRLTDLFKQTTDSFDFRISLKGLSVLAEKIGRSNIGVEEHFYLNIYSEFLKYTKSPTEYLLIFKELYGKFSKTYGNLNNTMYHQGRHDSLLNEVYKAFDKSFDHLQSMNPNLRMLTKLRTVVASANGKSPIIKKTQFLIEKFNQETLSYKSLIALALEVGTRSEEYVYYLNKAIDQIKAPTDKFINVLNELYPYGKIDETAFLPFIEKVLSKTSKQEDYLRIFPSLTYVGSEKQLVGIFERTIKNFSSEKVTTDFLFKLGEKATVADIYSGGYRSYTFSVSNFEPYLRLVKSASEYNALIDKIIELQSESLEITGRSNMNGTYKPIANLISSTFDHFESFDPSIVELEEMKSKFTRDASFKKVDRQINRLIKYGANTKLTFKQKCSELLASILKS